MADDPRSGVGRSDSRDEERESQRSVMSYKRQRKEDEVEEILDTDWLLLEKDGSEEDGETPFATNDIHSEVRMEKEEVAVDERQQLESLDKKEMVGKRPRRTVFTVAASAKSGLGFGDFLDTLGDALSLFLTAAEIFVPYNKDDGVIAQIHNQGVVDVVEYRDTGTYLKCRVPKQMLNSLENFKVKKNATKRKRMT